MADESGDALQAALATCPHSRCLACQSPSLKDRRGIQTSPVLLVSLRARQSMHGGFSFWVSPPFPSATGASLSRSVDSLQFLRVVLFIWLHGRIHTPHFYRFQSCALSDLGPLLPCPSVLMRRNRPTTRIVRWRIRCKRNVQPTERERRCIVQNARFRKPSRFLTHPKCYERTGQMSPDTGFHRRK